MAGVLKDDKSIVESMSTFDVIIITSYPFPIGLASTNRIMSYAKELAKTKRVLVLSFAQSGYHEGVNHFLFGVSNNVKYRYIRPSDPKRKSIVSKIAYRFITVAYFYYLLLFKYRTACVISYFHDVSYTKRLYLLSRITNFRIYKDITETFEIYFGSDDARKKQIKLQGLFDGLIVMTKEIGSYFSSVNKKQFVLPMGVDITRFCNKQISIGKYFFYCSGGVLERDGLLDSLKGFVIFSRLHPDYSFKIASSINQNDAYHKMVMDLINNTPSIEYLGVVPSTEIPSLMLGAIALIVTPHHDYVTKGFPTKLGEYLASGRPVICTSIPSLAENIDEGCTYMVKPNSPQDIENAMEEIVSHPDNAKNVAEKGYDFVKNRYTVAPYLSNFMNFLEIE